MPKLLTALTLIIAAWRPYFFYPTSIPIFKTIEIEKNEILFLLSESGKTNNQIAQEDSIPLKDKLDKNIFNKKSYSYIVSIDEPLRNILHRYSINIHDVNCLIALDKELCNLKIGQKLYWTLTSDGRLQHLAWEIPCRETRIYDRISNGFKISRKITQSYWISSVMKGTIHSDFFSSAYEAGLTSSEIYAVIKVMQWQIDFRKLKKGDAFAVLMSREILDGNRKQSRLVGVRLCSRGKDYYAIRAEDGKFYDRNGFGLTNGFLCFPTSKQFRISSNFNLHRLNPVTGRIEPHRGVDFAIPQGTPVLAVSDGEVVIAKRSEAAGYYVVVRHGQSYTTRYMHLCKLLVKPGQKVKYGDQIALSGNTGRSTGPHLHYEVWVNQKAVNPLTTKLPHIEELTGRNKIEYLSQVKEVVQQLCFN